MSYAKQLAREILYHVTRFVGAVTKRYYVEDYCRVYPNGVAYNRVGMKRKAREQDLKNYLNHQKFYKFAAQFVQDKAVVDVGCGSGYGCETLAKHGASRVSGCDISSHALKVAEQQYGDIAEFKQQGITDLCDYSDAEFDLIVCSEVLEHIKEYGQEAVAVQELKRIAREGGLLVVATPNSELLTDHGFSYAEINNLFASQFDDYLIFENALIPTGELKQRWLGRLQAGETGVVISQDINLEETVLLENVQPELKSGIATGTYHFCDMEIDTTLLHNTHSWVVIAVK